MSTTVISPETQAVVDAHASDAAQRRVDLEQFHMLQQRVRECYRKQGINHYEDCREHVEKYKQALAAHRTRGDGL
eukprot:m.34724 g.34724  ORF g.34724 m.34724 type:complete len:75 (+) comp9800_c1_seq1:185-409(+)